MKGMGQLVWVGGGSSSGNVPVSWCIGWHIKLPTPGSGK